MLQVFGINGRINRLTWWIVQIAVFMVGYLVRQFFAPAFPTNKADLQALLVNQAAIQHLAQQYMAVFPIFLVSGILTHWLFISTSVQRLHDRDSAGWRVVFAYVPYLVLIASFCNVLARGALSVSLLGLLMGLVGFLVSIVWLIVECGILPGDESPNEYGDPPGAAARRAQLKEELQAMIGETGGSGSYEPTSAYQPPPPTPQAAMSFASTSARPSFGKR